VERAGPGGRGRKGDVDRGSQGLVERVPREFGALALEERFEPRDRFVDDLARARTLGRREAADGPADGRDLSATPQKADADRLEGGFVGYPV